MRRSYACIVFYLWLILAGCNKHGTQSESGSFAWEFSTPEAQGVNPELVDSVFIHADQTGFVHSILLVRNGYILAERYYRGYTASTTHDVKSVSKSFLSAMTGIALREGIIDSLEEHMLDYFPEYIYPGMDPRKYGITLRHLLTMRMGLENEENNYFHFINSDNWIQATIEYPLAFTPGERFVYNTFETHLLSGILTKASGMSTRVFAEKHLTGPMGITIDLWQQDPQGYYFGGNSMHFTPREMAVLGLLYLNHGRLNDVQIVPEEWVAFTTSPSTDWGDNAWGPFTDYNYGYLWWLGRINHYDVFMALGFGGQFVICIPEVDMIIVTTAGVDVDWDTADVQELAILEIISAYILPAIVD